MGKLKNQGRATGRNDTFHWVHPEIWHVMADLPSGKRLHNYGKSPCLMGKLTISMAIFNRKLLNYQRVQLGHEFSSSFSTIGPWRRRRHRPGRRWVALSPGPSAGAVSLLLAWHGNRGPEHPAVPCLAPVAVGWCRDQTLFYGPVLIVMKYDELMYSNDFVEEVVELINSWNSMAYCSEVNG